MHIKKPIVIIGAPRSGTTLVYSIISSHPSIWSLYGESEWIVKRFHSPEMNGWGNGNRLSTDDISRAQREAIYKYLYKAAHNYQIVFPNSCSRIYTNVRKERLQRLANRLIVTPFFKPDSIRLVEKNPKNTLRIEFMNALFPDAYFIHLIREPRANISSLLDGWRANGRFATYDVPGGVDLLDYNDRLWNFLLPPGWREYARGRRLVEVCAFQYRVANEHALKGLAGISDKRKILLRYEALVDNPVQTVKHLCHDLELEFVGGLKRFAEEMPSVNSITGPRHDKWKRNEEEVNSVLDEVSAISTLLDYTHT